MPGRSLLSGIAIATAGGEDRWIIISFLRPKMQPIYKIKLFGGSPLFGLLTTMTLLLFLCITHPAAAAELTLEQILDKVEARYAGSGFKADFLQESTIKAMQISDFAKGKIFVSYPGKMRWEYNEPDNQIIITDGHQLWIYRPEDNQVMTGKAPDFFRNGKGASFLSNIKLLRDKFDISLQSGKNDLFFNLKLVPLEKSLDLTEIQLSVSRITYSVVRVITINAHDDETRIELINFQFDVKLDESLFSFDIPEGVDVLQLDE